MHLSAKARCHALAMEPVDNDCFKAWKDHLLRSTKLFHLFVAQLYDLQRDSGQLGGVLKG